MRDVRTVVRSAFGRAWTVVAAAAFGVVISAQTAATLKNPVTPTAESLAAGKQIYTRRCASCHGVSGEGGPGNDLIPAAPDLTDATWEHGSTDGDIFTSVKEGIGPDFNMTPFKDMLKDEEIWNVVNYVRSLAKNRPRS